MEHIADEILPPIKLLAKIIIKRKQQLGNMETPKGYNATMRAREGSLRLALLILRFVLFFSPRDPTQNEKEITS